MWAQAPMCFFRARASISHQQSGEDEKSSRKCAKYSTLLCTPLVHVHRDIGMMIEGRKLLGASGASDQQNKFPFQPTKIK